MSPICETITGVNIREKRHVGLDVDKYFLSWDRNSEGSLEAVLEQSGVDNFLFELLPEVQPTGLGKEAEALSVELFDFIKELDVKGLKTSGRLAVDECLSIQFSQDEVTFGGGLGRPSGFYLEGQETVNNLVYELLSYAGLPEGVSPEELRLRLVQALERLF